MRVFVIETGRTLSPFGEGPGAMVFGHSHIGEATDRAFALLGHDVSRLAPGAKVPEHSGPCVVLADHCYVSHKCAQDWLKAVGAAQAISRLALCRTPASDYARPVSSIVIEPLDDDGPGARPAGATGAEADATERCLYDCFYVPEGELPAPTASRELLDKLRERAKAVVAKKREVGIEIRLPLLGDPERTRMIYPVTSTVAGHVEHWVHVLWLNHQAFGVQIVDMARKDPAWAAKKAIGAFPPTDPAKVVPRLVHCGENVEIHPTATVEGSLLGDNVRIGARATVRNSILGRDVEVGDHGSVIACTLADGAFVTPKSFFVWSTAFEGAVVNNLKMQMSVLGRGAASNHWAGLIDAKFQGSIGVTKDGEVVSTERSFLGSCIGHDGYIGAKAILMPGREIPNGVFVTMRPDELICEVPDDLPAGVPVVRDGGTLIPLTALRARLAAQGRPPVRSRDERSGDERSGDERSGDERSGDERPSADVSSTSS
jgi:carbonic anhydrase/acetyltransferase-like protein (isoleucine patch superfamily)